MRLIDAEALERSFIDVMLDNTPVSRTVVLGMINSMPTITPQTAALTLYGFSVRELAVAATLLRKGKVTPEKLAETMTNVKKLMEFLLEDLQGIVQSSLANIYKEEPDERVGDLFMRSYGRGIDRECRVDRDPGD